MVDPTNKTEDLTDSEMENSVNKDSISPADEQVYDFSVDDSMDDDLSDDPWEQVAQLELEMASLQEEIATLKDQALRAMADAENTRRRAKKERQDMSKYATSSFAREMLPVADNLRRALDAVSEEDKNINNNVKNLIIGIEATERQLLAAFESAGIQKVDSVGEQFDPNLHRVMFEVDGSDQPAGTVVQVLQSGYKIHDRLLREAMVGVSKGPSDEEASHKVDTTA